MRIEPRSDVGPPILAAGRFSNRPQSPLKAGSPARLPAPHRTATLLFVCATLASAQSTAEKRGKAVIDDAIKALGGEKFLSMKDRVESGRAYSFYREELSGLSIAKIYTRYLTVALGKTGEELGSRERQAFGKNEESAVLFLETGGACGSVPCSQSI